MFFRLIAPVAALAGLAGCSTVNPGSQSTDPAFGEAFRYNMALQTIDPDPAYDATGAQPGDSGARGAEAVKRYRTDQVKDVEVMVIESGSRSGGDPR